MLKHLTISVVAQLSLVNKWSILLQSTNHNLIKCVHKIVAVRVQNLPCQI